MPTTTNFGWTTPADTDLVKDGASAIRTLGNGIDTSFLDLKGGTTGQVLSKASNTDLDFTWSSVDPLKILDAKGDLISATAADTPARLAVGANGTVLTADSAETTGLKWATPTSGGYTELATGSLSGASVSLTSISGSYKELRLIISNFRPADDNVTIRGRFNNDTGSNYIEAQSFTSSGLAASYGQFEISPSSDNGTPAQGLVILDIPNYANTTTYKWAQSRGTANNPTTSTQLNWRQYNIFWFSTAAINRIDFFPGSGNFTSGTYQLLGLN